MFRYYITVLCSMKHILISVLSVVVTRAVLSQGGPRDAAVNFDKKIYNGIARFLCHFTAFL